MARRSLKNHIEYKDHLPDEFRNQALQLYFLALKDKLEPLFGSDDRAFEAISTNIATDRCIIAVCDRQIAGILGTQTDQGGFLKSSLKMLVKQFGVFSGIFRMGGLALMHHPTASDELYIGALL